MRLFDTKRHHSIINSFQKAGKVLKSIAVTLVVTLIAQSIAPTILAAQEGKLTPKAKSSKEVKAEMFKSLQGLSNRLTQIKRGGKFDRKHALDRIETLENDVKNTDAAMLATFTEEEAWIKSKNLPPVILERHQKMVQHYKSQTQALLEESEATLISERGSLLDKAKALNPFKEKKEKIESPFQDFDPKQFTKGHKPFDPKMMPTRHLKPNPDNKPKMDKADFTLSGLESTPQVYTAALGDFTYDNLPDATNPAYLSTSDEIVAADVINEKAKELNYDPVKINQWVRNNIEYLPTWGSAQNAELTLEAKRGNAMDIASLTIALLRASKIPSRYVHGTIEVPAEQFKNWMGGFSDLYAAYNYAGQGGIPAVAVVEGGKVTRIQMEHVWVEAAIDYYPSRGAKNRDADSWVQMDPSYKQYTFKEGVDVLAISGIDPEQLAQDLLASGTVNEAEGWATDFNATILENALAESQTKLESYIDNNMTDPNVLDVIGGRQVIIKEFPNLPSSLPNRIVVAGARYDKIPQQLQQRTTVSFYGTQYQGLYGDKRTVTFPYARVNNEKLTLSFRPATQADEDTLNALIPDGNITDISQLPSSISANLIDVVPELKLNGNVVATGIEMSLGTKVDIMQSSYLPGLGNVLPFDHTTVAGSCLNINLVSQTISIHKLISLHQRLITTQKVLRSNSQVVNGKSILEDMLYAGTLLYYGEQQNVSDFIALQTNVNTSLRVGHGVFGYEPNVTYLYGLPWILSSGGIKVDLADLSASEAVDGNVDDNINYRRQSGTLGSTLEHLIPEQLFSDPYNPSKGFSSMKALKLALEEGQKIYKINNNNIDIILPKLQLAQSVLDDIARAVNVGYTVITHEKRIGVNGYIGEGYIILDENGNGVYLINGGLNGGVLVEQQSNRTLYNLTILGEADLPSIDWSLKGIVVGVMLAISVTYKNDAELPTAGYGHFNFLEAKLNSPLTKALNDYFIVAAWASGSNGFIGDDITTVMVMWYFYGAGNTLYLNQIKGAAEAFERGVKRETYDYMKSTVADAVHQGCSGYSLSDRIDINVLKNIFGIARSQLLVNTVCSQDTCTFSFSLRDWFRDALDLNDKMEGYQDAIGGIPFEIHHDFEGNKPCVIY